MKKINLEKILGDDAKYVDEDSAAALEDLPESAWAVMAAAWSDHNGDGAEPGIDCKVAVTSESLADFDAAREKHWSEAGRREELNYSGNAALKFSKFQTRRGDKRRHAIVIDFGELRAILSDDGYWTP